MPKTFPNVFAFYGQENEREKTIALCRCHGTGMKCATDRHGNPQAFFRLPVVPDMRVLGKPRSEELTHKPIKMLEAPK